MSFLDDPMFQFILICTIPAVIVTVIIHFMGQKEREERLEERIKQLEEKLKEKEE